MLAYANPSDINDERKRADGYGLVRFDKQAQRITFECWPRFPNSDTGDREQFPGWPVTIDAADSDGRQPKAWLPELSFESVDNPVVQVVEQQTGEVLYTMRIKGAKFRPPVFAAGLYTVRIGRDKPGDIILEGIEAVPNKKSGSWPVKL
jgi:hypothetical protein